VRSEKEKEGVTPDKRYGWTRFFVLGRKIQYDAIGIWGGVSLDWGRTCVRNF